MFCDGIFDGVSRTTCKQAMHLSQYWACSSQKAFSYSVVPNLFFQKAFELQIRLQWRVPDRRACTHGARLDSAQKDNVGPPSNGLTICGRDHRGQVQWELSGSHREKSWRPDPMYPMVRCPNHLSDREGVRAGVRGQEV